MPYTPEELDELASDAAWDGGDIATMMEVFAQAARDARLRQGVERLRDEWARDGIGSGAAELVAALTALLTKTTGDT